MLQNYLKIILRNLIRNKLYASINILGLAIGLACCMLIFLYVYDEFSYDNFHKNLKNLYRVNTIIKEKTGTYNYNGMTPPPLAKALQDEIPEVATVTRVFSRNHVIRKGTEIFFEEIHFCDANFFDVFTFPLLSGDKKLALQNNTHIVLTEDLAKKYFGRVGNAIGRTLQVEIEGNFYAFTVVAVAQNPPQNSSIQFKIVLPFSKFEAHNGEDAKYYWLAFYINTFVQLKNNTNPQEVNAKLPKIIKKYTKESIETAKKEFGLDGNLKFSLQDFEAIHLDNTFHVHNGLQKPSNVTYSYLLTGIGIFILLIGCINFTNLSIAQSLPRTKEVGVRKVMGANRRQLIFQFLGESLLLCSLAFALGMVLAELALPLFCSLSDKKLYFPYGSSLILVFAGITLIVITSILAGIYPAFVLSGLNPILTLKGKVKVGGRNNFTRFLIMLQFMIAAFLITATLIINEQLNFILKKDLGYNPVNLLSIPTSIRDAESIAETFKQDLAFRKDVFENISTGPQQLGNTRVKINQREFITFEARYDYETITTFQHQLILGRSFSKNYGLDKTESVIVNEAFVKKAGLLHPIGAKLSLPWQSQRNLKIIGVVQDFHFQSLYHEIKPMLLHLNSDFPVQAIWVRFKNGKTREGLKILEKQWKKTVEFYPFEYKFQQIRHLEVYRNEMRWQQIIAFSSLFAIFIACIGLFGLASLTIHQRAKEIGIRKVMGASIQSLIFLLTSEFNRMVLIGMLVATPFTYIILRYWLQYFAYRTELNIIAFLLPTLSIILLATLTVSYQAFCTARENPVDNLKYE